jgi:aspartyl-tRNA synthetase
VRGTCDVTRKQVDICGWLTYVRGDRFAILRDYAGVIQCVTPDALDELDADSRRALFDVHIDSVVRIHGVVCKRPDKMNNPKMPTGACARAFACSHAAVVRR